MRKLLDLFKPQGTIAGGAYLLTGVAAFAIKYLVDRWVAGMLMHRPWMPWQYMNPLYTTVSLVAIGPAERQFLLVMSAVALPFIWLGVTVTLKRLRSTGLPPWLVVLFFIPVINLVFFLALCIAPAGTPRTAAAAHADPGYKRDAVLALAISSVICLAAVWIGTKLLGRYGLGLFVALPFCVGLVSVLIFTWRAPRRYGECVAVAALSAAVAGGGLFAFAAEGAVCLLMAAPIALPLAALGGTVGYWMRQPFQRRDVAALVLLAALYPPAVMGSEALAHLAPPEFAVTTTIDVNAPPARVWHNVISFSQLPDPPEWIFRAGIAYPMRAEIQGRGPGAVRHCVFSTGPFVEPITVWDEPRRLEFTVARNPPPMHEWSPYRDLHPRHFDGFLVSHRGRFLLTPLADGRTRLEGTTWYEHGLWPSGYWRIWSDFVIHRIHLRVLHHIRQLSE